MKMSIILSYLLLLLLSCHIQEREHHLQSITFYHRNILGADYPTYHDFLALSDYIEHPKTAKELYKIAKNYVDTVKAQLPVDGVTLMAKDVEGPKLHWDSEIWGEEKKYCLISFDFNHFKKAFANDPLELFMITIWKQSTPLFYNIGKDKMYKSDLDSILNSPTPIVGEK